MKPEPTPEQNSAPIFPDPDADLPSGSTPNPSAIGAPNPQALCRRKRILIWLVLFILIGLPTGGWGGYWMVWALVTGMIMEATSVFWYLMAACFLAFSGTATMLALGIFED